MVADSLEAIQSLQFRDNALASAALRTFFNGYLPFHVVELHIRKLAVSLNSINGFLTTDDGRRLFFKTHVEPQGIISEYYNSDILSNAGYNVVRPIHSVTEPGKQVLIYQLVDLPSLFDVLHDVETGQQPSDALALAAQARSDAELYAIYARTLQVVSAAEHARAPVHQLFHHRLVGGRFAEFYEGKPFSLPGQPASFAQLKQLRWRINAVEYAETLDTIIQRAIRLLKPSAAMPCVVGHGDAHNGNLFLDARQGELVYFDPAFAGLHSPFLDLAKPLFHNVFARWLYFPADVLHSLKIVFTLSADTIVVQHDFVPSATRVALLRSKLSQVVKPLLHELHSRGWLAADWRRLLKAALFCCPFLTMNLADRQRFPPEIALLGLCMALEMGGTPTGAGRSLLDAELDAVAGPPATAEKRAS